MTFSHGAALGPLAFLFRFLLTILFYTCRWLKCHLKFIKVLCCSLKPVNFWHCVHEIYNQFNIHQNCFSWIKIRCKLSFETPSIPQENIFHIFATFSSTSPVLSPCLSPSPGYAACLIVINDIQAHASCYTNYSLKYLIIEHISYRLHSHVQIISFLCQIFVRSCIAQTVYLTL